VNDESFGVLNSRLTTHNQKKAPGGAWKEEIGYCLFRLTERLGEASIRILRSRAPV